MNAAPQQSAKKLAEPLMIADHAVLDFLNTVVMLDGERIDFFANERDVEDWLKQSGFSTPPGTAPRPHKLLETARAIREIIGEAIERRKLGKPLQLAAFNRLLAKSSSHLMLSQHRSQGVELARSWPSGTAEQLLGPIIEAAAELLATGDFDLIRRCEDQTCILWFYDRTKSHHRRWCSMSTCGNRFKVAAFRERRRARAS